MKKENLIITIIFISLLFLPNIVYWFIKDKMDNNNYESRELYKKPELTFSTILSFPKNYENYFNDSLAFKNESRSIRSKILYNIFKTSSDSKVIIGKNKWLFFNSAAANDMDSISDFRNFSSYSNEEMNVIKDELVSTKEKLNKKNIDFYVLVLPNKENAYSDYLPSLIKKSNRGYSKTELLINYLNKETDLNIVYPKNELIKGRDSMDTYYKYDTHWNDFGAYLGVKVLMKTIDSDFKMEKATFIKKFEIGGLSKMNLTKDYLNTKEILLKEFMNNVNTSCKIETEFRDCESNGVYDKTVLFVGDSFRDATVQYLGKIYKKSIFIHKFIYNEELIEKYKPDIIIYEAVERYSSTLVNANQLIK